MPRRGSLLLRRRREPSRRSDVAPSLPVRRLEAPDLTPAAVLSSAAFGIDISTPPLRERWIERVAHACETDPAGSFVAERDGRIVGAAQALLRDGVWVLSLLTVDPRAQSRGAGRALLEAALGYGAPAAPGLIVSSNDARALRLYARAGFSLSPALQAEGTIDRAALPALGSGMREETDPDLEQLAEISRAIRGAAHTPELRYALRRGARLIQAGGRGFAVVQPGQGVWLLVAHDEDTASALLWSALALASEEDRAAVRWIHGVQDWAVRIVLSAGLRLSAYGALCTRGDVGPLVPFIPSAPFA